MGVPEADQVTDDRDRDRLGDGGYPITSSGSGDVIKTLADSVANHALVFEDMSRCERGTHKAPQPGMDRGIHVDHRSPGFESVFVDVVYLNVAYRRRIGRGVARDLDHVRVPSDCPEPVAIAGRCVVAGRSRSRGSLCGAHAGRSRSRCSLITSCNLVPAETGCGSDRGEHLVWNPL